MCECLKLVNEKLAKHNTRVISTISLVNGTLKFVGVRIATEEIKKERGAEAISLTAAYCPFCGDKYEQAK